MGDMPMPQILLQYNGLFDFDGMYMAIIDWAKHYEYNWHEKDYKHKVPDQGAEQEMVWMMNKKVTDYIHFNIVITVHIWEMYDVAVQAEGKKKTLTNARMSLKMDGKVTYDWQKRFGEKGFRGWLGKTYYKLMKKDLEGIYYDMLYYRMWNLHAILKKYMDMQSKYYAYKGYLKED